MNKQISTRLGIVVVFFVVGVAGASVLFFENIILNEVSIFFNQDHYVSSEQAREQEDTTKGIRQGIIFSDEDGNVYQNNFSGPTIKLTKFPHGDGSFFVDEKGNNILWIELTGGHAEEYGVKNALLYKNGDNSQRQVKEILDTEEQTTLNHLLSPSGKFLAYIKTAKKNLFVAENTSLVILDLSSREETTLIKNFSLALTAWSQDEKKLFLTDHKSTSGYSSPWFINDVILSLDIDSKEQSVFADYEPICDKPSAVSLVEKNENLILAKCDLIQNHERVAIKVYDRNRNQTETLIEGSPFNEITGFYLSPDGDKLVYYSISDKAFVSFERNSKKKEILKNLETIQNQGIFFSPDSSKFIYTFKEDISPPGIFIYDFVDKSVNTIEKKASFITWIKE